MHSRIEVNPEILSGKAVIKGTRIPVYLILELLSTDYDFKKNIESLPIVYEKRYRSGYCLRS